MHKLNDDHKDYNNLVSDDKEPSDKPSRKRSKVNISTVESWRNKEGEQLTEFGVDEEADFDDEDELSLAKLMLRGQAAGKAS